jgi:hypothetical protein
MPRNNRDVVHPTKKVTVLPKATVVMPKTTGVASPGLGQIVKEGMAFGVGNAVAHSVIGRLFGGVAVAPASVAPPSEKTAYNHCLELTNGNQEVCDHLLGK